MSSFGKIFNITTFGESHCNSVGAIIQNCPPCMKLSEADIQPQLNRRRPGQSAISTPRNEFDIVEILSGVENGLTLGTPICARVKNKDFIPSDYDFLDRKQYVPRPSHADYTYLQKYGIHASSGGGRSSARETIGRVIGGAIAEKWLKENYNIEIVAYVNSVGSLSMDDKYNKEETEVLMSNLTRKQVDKTIVRCPDESLATNMIDLITQTKKDGDSLGGTIRCVCRNVPTGLGEPCFDKLEALLAHAMLSIPATKGFEIGSGFDGTKMNGSQHNDVFEKMVDLNDDTGKLSTKTNNSGGIQGGISNGENITFKVAFKPASTISKDQNTVNISGDKVCLKAKGRHDPCVVNRAVPIVEAMTALVLMDCLLIQKSRM